MDRRELQTFIEEKFKPHFDAGEAQRMAQYLMEDLVPLSTEVISVIEDKLNKAAQRIINGEPLQYVTHRADFYGYQFYVDEAVLIPRPETEELVYQVLQYIKKNRKKNLDIIDIGTGSGCIPVSIKKENSNCNITAIDVSKAALAVAIKNANNLGAEVTFAINDILADDYVLGEKRFDIIVSNPPYIPRSEEVVMSESTLKYEPPIALFTDDEFGLLFYQRIADVCEQWLAYDGAVFLELNEYHAIKIKEIYASMKCFSVVEIINDMQGKPRILKAIC